MTLLSSAIRIAAICHDGQLDKGGLPYILHPLKVMELVKSRGYGEYAQALAVAHDILEDHPEFVPDIIADIVKATGSVEFYNDLKILCKDHGMLYHEYISRIIDSGKPEIIVVKLCDIEHNSSITRLKGIRKKDLDRIEKYHKSYIRLNEALKALEK